MSCRMRHQGCKKYAQKYELNAACRKFPKLENPLEKWECSDAEERTCPQFKPYPPRMTAEEFEAASKEILETIPEEFKSALSGMAWDRGHSAGYEEVVSCLRELVSDLSPSIGKFIGNFYNRVRRDERIRISNEYPSLSLDID